MKLTSQRKILAISIACSIFLSACGGGEDLRNETAAQNEAATALASVERESAASLSSASLSSDSTEDTSARFGPDDFAGDELPILDPLTFVTEQARESGPVSSALVAGTVTKWNPGHYVQFGSNANDFVIDAALKETAGMPFVKGIMIRASWWQLEKGKGNYDFSRIDRYLAKAKAKNKRLFLMVGTKTFDGDKAVPDYLRTAQYSGGAFRIGTIKGTYGENMALHDDDVRDRLIALMQALGRRYNKDNNFEGVAFNETAWGKMVKPLSSTQQQRFFSNFAKVDTATRSAFSNSVVIQFMNYPANFMPALFENMKDKGVGMGGPDVFINDPALERGAYTFNSKAKGVIPIGMKVESDCYNAVRHGGPYTQVDVRKLYSFARDRLHSNYIFWNRYTAKHNPWQDVLRMFKGEAFPTGSAGGLNAACPSKFASCAPRL
jgi:hypothetical protein